jgi:hypothetical protein
VGRRQVCHHKIQIKSPAGNRGAFFIFNVPLQDRRQCVRNAANIRATCADRTALMRRTFAVLLGLLIGYPVFAFVGYWAIALFSNNGFDRSVEASMTAVFAIGPAGAVVGLIVGLVWGGPRRQAIAPPRSDETM